MMDLYYRSWHLPPSLIREAASEREPENETAGHHVGGSFDPTANVSLPDTTPNETLQAQGGAQHPVEVFGQAMKHGDVLRQSLIKPTLCVVIVIRFTLASATTSAP
jgi:hypothetical protein